MLKEALFRGEDEHGTHAVPLFTRSFEKVASAASLLKDVERFISNLRPQKGSQYVLVNALAAGEYFGSNINGDYFPEAALIHAPNDWKGIPAYDRIKSKNWPYGYPTFYSAYPYAHHRNKDSSKAFGEVELSAWNEPMKRVELVVRIDEDKCARFGAQGVWDKIQAGGHPDVSMGCRVPYDTCSICLDWDAYKKAQATFNPSRHKSPGEAVLEYHRKVKKIRGLAITRVDYCEHAKKLMNKILPDGRKVFVYNDYPNFFDISFVFIGADRTAKTMLKIAGDQKIYWTGQAVKSAEFIEVSIETGPQEKTASVSDDVLKLAFMGKDAKDKAAEIVKEVMPPQFARKAVPVLTDREDDLPNDILEAMATRPLEEGLATSGSLGLVLKPREFQRIILIQIGLRSEADDLDRRGHVFPETRDVDPMSLSSSGFSSALARILAPFISGRSVFGPSIEKRVIAVSGRPQKKVKEASSLSTPLMCKLASAYNGYRLSLMDLVSHAQSNLGSSGLPEFQKMAEADVQQVFTPLSVAYLKYAFRQVPFGSEQTAHNAAGVEQDNSCEEHVTQPPTEFLGGYGS